MTNYQHAVTLQDICRSNCTIAVQVKPVLLRSSAYDTALELKEFLSEQELPADVKACLESGIVLGKEKIEGLDRQLNDIAYWLNREYPGCQLLDELPNATMTFQRILKPTDYDIGMVYHVSESVAIQDLDEDTEWVMKITKFIVYGPILNRYHLFVDGNYYAAKLRNRSELDIDTWTNEPKMIPKHYAQRCVQPVRLVDRKVILYPEPARRENPRHFLIIDSNSPIILTSITVPHYPATSEVITPAAIC